MDEDEVMTVDENIEVSEEDLLKSIKDTLTHQQKVKDNILFMTRIMLQRGYHHDDSKMKDPELKTFALYGPKLKSLTYGSDEYKKCLDGMNKALDHHYKHNSHHPEYHVDGIQDMDLFNLMEMFFDWCAAVERHADGDINKSITHNKERFGYSTDIEKIFRNTAGRMQFKKYADEVIDGIDNVDNRWNLTNVKAIVYDWMATAAIETPEYATFNPQFTEAEIELACSVTLELNSRYGIG